LRSLAVAAKEILLACTYAVVVFFVLVKGMAFRISSIMFAFMVTLANAR
jgi:hypothetical protein